MQTPAWRVDEVNPDRGTVDPKNRLSRGSMTRLHHGQQSNLAIRGRSSVVANLIPKTARSNQTPGSENGGQAPTSRNTQGSSGSYGRTLSTYGYVSPYGHSLPTEFSLAVSPGAMLSDTEHFGFMSWDHDSTQREIMDNGDDDASVFGDDNIVSNPTSWSQGHIQSSAVDSDMLDLAPGADSFAAQRFSFAAADAGTPFMGAGVQVGFYASTIQDVGSGVENFPDEMNIDAFSAGYSGDEIHGYFMPRARSPAPELYPPIQPRPQHLETAQSQIVAANTLNPKPGTRRKGRDGPLPESIKAAAARVRLRGACARCHTMKERCDDQTPCGPCQNPHRRKHDLPCMKAWPREKACHVLSDLTIGHLNLQEFKKSLPFDRLVGNNFTIRIRQDFETVLRIPVLEFRPRNERDIYKFTFPIKDEGEKFAVKPLKILSPPLVPDVRTTKQMRTFITSVREQTKIWLRGVEDENGAEWSATFFPPEYGQQWPRAVMWHVCSFYNWAMKRGCPPLQAALNTTVIMHMIGHAFYIVPEDVETVMGQLKYPIPEEQQPGGFVCPQFIDRMMKVALCPLLTNYLQRSLQLYEDLAEKEKHPSHLTRDRIFCISVVLLIIGAVQQAKSVEKSAIHVEHKEVKDMHRAYVKILEIETEFIDPIFDIWNYKFKIDQPMRGDVEGEDRPLANRAEQFDVLERFRSTYQDNEADLVDLDVSLPKNPDIKAFSATNVTRVLKRLYLVVFQDAKSKDKLTKQEG